MQKLRKCKPTTCIPYVSADQYVVQPLTPGQPQCAGGFCTYPVQNPFSYEIPPNVCFPEAQPPGFFPGQSTSGVAMDPSTGQIYRKGSNLTFCPNGQGTAPQVNLDPDRLPNGAPKRPKMRLFRKLRSQVQDALPDFDPAVSTEERNENASYGYPYDELESLPNQTSATRSRMCTLNNIFPGEQEVKSHRWVAQNRYDGEQQVSNIYVKPYPTEAVEYTNSLYMTPYDSAQNKIATGILKNSMTGEIFETFVNQLPPPTSTTNQFPEYQLRQANPLLVWAQGGYNNHKPPPAKTEQPGYVFNPVSARGGAPPFGSSTFADDIRAQSEALTFRDLYNNQDGNFPCERSLYGEAPQGYIGLVPRLRTVPYINPTNELSLEGYMPVQENLNPDLRKREQYTGKVYARKAHVSATRGAAVGLVNGVQAVADIPMKLDRTLQKREDTLPVGPAGRSLANGVLASEQKLRPTHLKGKTYSRTAAAAGRDFANGVLVDGSTIRPTTKNPSTYRTAPVTTGIRSGVMVTDKTVRHTLKTAAVENPFRTAGINDPTLAASRVIASLTKLKPTLKVTMQETFPVGQANREGDGTYVQLDKTLRQTMKQADPNQTFVPPVNAGHMGDYVGGGQSSTTQHRGCQQQLYLPSASMIPAAANGTSTRIVQPLSRKRQWNPENFVKPMGQANYPTTRYLNPAPMRPKRCLPNEETMGEDSCDF